MSSASPTERVPSTSLLLTPLPPRDGERIERLPNPLTSFVGREAEVAAVRALLDRGDVRLVTLTGPGGIGKTRLAIEVGRQLHDEFAHGVCFVPLASIREPGLVAPTVAQTASVRESRDRPAAEILATLWRDRHLLLVLDNLEQVIGAAPWLANLLTACPRLKVLVTSRVPLRVGGEHRYPVPPLPVPEDADRASESSVPDAAAVELFVQRAGAVEPDFALSGANAAAVVAICRRLDGLPLAIELAAARSGVFDPPTLLTHLARPLPLLTGGASDAPPRLQTMRDAIAWSYDLLTPEEQALFCRLSVFVGGIPLDFIERGLRTQDSGPSVSSAAIGVKGEDAGPDPDSVLPAATSPASGNESSVLHAQRGHSPLDALASLVDKSLLRRVAGAGGEARFGMLETIREYGLERLEEAGEVAAARDAHAAYYAVLVGAAEGGLKGREQIAWLDRLDREHDNLRAALVWLAERGAIEQALTMAGGLWFFWWVRGHFSEGRRQLEVLLARPDAAARTVGRAWALNALGVLMYQLGDNVQSLACQEEALRLFREHNDRAGAAWALISLHHSLIVLRDLDRALAATEESLALYRELGDGWGVARAHGVLGVLAVERGEGRRAVPLLEEARRLAKELGERWIDASAAFSLSFIALEYPTGNDDHPIRTETLLEEVIHLHREMGDHRRLPAALRYLGIFRHKGGDQAHATSLFEEALTVARRTGDTIEIAGSLHGLGELARMQGDLTRASSLKRENLALVRELDSKHMMGDSIWGFASLAGTTGQTERAGRLLGAADRLFVASGAPLWDTVRAEFDAEVRSVRAALGEAAFTTAWDAGQAMTLDQAVAEADAVVAAIRAASRAKISTAALQELSPRELEVLRLMADGLSNQQIADALFLSFRTITSHVTSILAKLGVESRTGAVAHAIRAGLA